MPFFADPQSRVAYPIALMLVAVDPVDARAYDVAIHLVIAMLGMYLFLRSISVNAWGSLLGGLAFGFSSFFYVRLGHPTFIAAAAWIPFFFYGFEKARMRGPEGVVMLTAFLAMGYLAGFPQVFLFGVGALIAYALYTSFDTGRSDRKRVILGAAKIILIAGLLSLLLVAFQLVPFVELLRNSVGLGVDIEKMSDVYLAPPVLLLRSFFPDLFGNPIEGTDWSGLTRDLTHTYNPEFAVYCGLGTLLAAVGAMVFIRSDRRVRFFTALLLLSVGLATSGMLIRVGYALVPLLEMSKISRIAVLSCFALCTLGGMGFSMISDRLGPRERKRCLTAVGVVAVVVLVVAAYVALGTNSFLGRYLGKAEDLPDYFWKHTHRAMRSSRVQGWAEGDGREWIQYEKRQVGRGLVFLIPALGLFVLLAHPKKTPNALRTVFVVGFIGLVGLDAGLNTRGYFISQVSSRLFETEGIDLLKNRVGDEGMWRIRSVRYQHEDIKAFPPNTNLLFNIHSLNGTSTLWPEGYQSLYDAFSGSREVSKRWDKQMAMGAYEVLASDFACVRYVIADNAGIPVVFPPLVRLVAAKAGTPSRVRIVKVGREGKLALWQRPGETFNFSVELPRIRTLEFYVGLDAQYPGEGDSIAVWLMWARGRAQRRFRHVFNLARDRGRWHPFMLDVSGVGPGRVMIQMGCELLSAGRGYPVTVAWGGLDLVSGAVEVSQTADGYRVSMDENSKYLALELASPAGEVPLEIFTAGLGRRVRWISFPSHMPVRRIFLDVRERGDDSVVIRSDSAFALVDCDAVHMDVGTPDYQLIYDKDMYIYENQTAVRKGVCLKHDVLAGLGEFPSGPLAVAAFEAIGNIECGECNIVSYRPERVVLDVVAESDCYLVFQDVWYPGWKAYVDGAGTEIIPTDIGMRAIELASGTHRVEMVYAPGSLKLGLVLTGLGAVLLASYMMLSWREKAAHRRIGDGKNVG
jgi:hypothetical protein